MKRNLICLILLLSAGTVLALPWNLEPQSVTRYRGQYYDLTTDNGILYLACKRGVEIFSLADPGHPEMITSVLTEGLANGVEVNFPYLYVGDVYGFNVWNISDPANPTKLGGFARTTQGAAEGYQERLLYRDGYVYVAAYSTGLQVIDVLDPENPFIAARVDTPAYAWDLVLKDDAAFMMDFFSTEIIDISRPLAPLHRTSMNTMFASGIDVEGSLAFLGYVDGLLVWDITDPFAPVVISDIGPTGSGTAEAVDVRGNYAYVAHNSYVEIYDISIPSDPMQVSFFYPPGHARKLHVSGNFLYTVLDDNGFHVTDISDPENPIPGDHINPGTWGNRVDVVTDNGILYLCDWSRGLVIYDISDPDTLIELASYTTPGSLNDLVVTGGVAYLCCSRELVALDVSDPANPIYLGSYQTTGSPWSIVVQDSTGYLCDLYSFRSLDLSDPADIQLLDVLFLAKKGNPYQAALKGNLAYVANSWAGLNIIDISNPADLNRVASWPGDTSKSYSAISIHGDRLYALNGGSRVDFLDISNPLSPVETGEVRVEGSYTNDFHVRAGSEENPAELLYMAASDFGVFVMDVTDPGAPFLAAGASTPGKAIGVTIDDHRLYVADDYDLAIFTLTEPIPDTEPPAVTITAPGNGANITGKTAVIHGTARDTESGVRSVEVSLDGGSSWHRAGGQESWSFILDAMEPGYVTLNVRALDWAGNAGAGDTSVSIYYLPDRSRIMMAGFNTTHLMAGQSGTITFSALVFDPFDPGYINSVELYLEGESSGTILERIMEANGLVYYQAVFDATFDTTGTVTYSLVAYDTAGNPSARWPYVSSRE